MSKQEPTPRPWAAEEFLKELDGELSNVVSITYQRPDGGCRYVADLLPTWGGDGPPPAEVAANAALIVQAVNHHAALVSALLALVHPAAGDDDVDAARALLMDLGALAEGAPYPGEVQP